MQSTHKHRKTSFKKPFQKSICIKKVIDLRSIKLTMKVVLHSILSKNITKDSFSAIKSIVSHQRRIFLPLRIKVVELITSNTNDLQTMRTYMGCNCLREKSNDC